MMRIESEHLLFENQKEEEIEEIRGEPEKERKLPPIKAVKIKRLELSTTVRLNKSPLTNLQDKFLRMKRQELKKLKLEINSRKISDKDKQYSNQELSKIRINKD